MLSLFPPKRISMHLFRESCLSLFADLHAEVHTCASDYCKRYNCYCHYPKCHHNLFLSLIILLSIFYPSFFFSSAKIIPFVCAHKHFETFLSISLIFLIKVKKRQGETAILTFSLPDCTMSLPQVDMIHSHQVLHYAATGVP